MNRKLIEIWLFLAVLVLVPPPEIETKPLNITDDSGRDLKGPVDKIPQNETEYFAQTKHLNCSPGLKAMYLLHPQKKETYIGCYKDKLIHGFYCPEFNTNGPQPKYNAPCNITNTVLLCDASYYASEGHKFRKCFDIYGGISSPNERETCTSITPATTPLGAPMKIFLGFLIIQFCFVILIILYIFCIGFCISKHWYKNDITYKRYLRGAFTALPNCIVQIARGET